jgi:hypothetical protein
MPRAPRLIPRQPGRPFKMPDPAKAVIAAPRIKPTSTREYGKGGTPYSSGPDMGVRGAGIGYGGPNGPLTSI